MWATKWQTVDSTANCLSLTGTVDSVPRCPASCAAQRFALCSCNLRSSINNKSKIYRNRWLLRNKESEPSPPWYLTASQLSCRTSSSSAQPQQKRGSIPGQDKTVLSSSPSPDRLWCREWSWPLIPTSIQVQEWVQLYLHSTYMSRWRWLRYRYCICLYTAVQRGLVPVLLTH